MTKEETQQLIDCCFENIDAIYRACAKHPELIGIKVRAGYNVLTLLSQTKTLMEQLKQ